MDAAFASVVVVVFVVVFSAIVSVVVVVGQSRTRHTSLFHRYRSRSAYCVARPSPSQLQPPPLSSLLQWLPAVLSSLLLYASRDLITLLLSDLPWSLSVVCYSHRRCVRLARSLSYSSS